MKGKRTTSRREDGQILAIFAGALVVLILISGLVIDGGNVFVTRRDSQDSRRHRVDGRHEASRRLLREEPDVHVDRTTSTPRSRPGWTRTTAPVPPARSARGPRATSVRGPAPSFQDLGPVSVHGHGTARRDQRPEGPRRQGQRHEDAADIPSRGHRPVDLDGQLDGDVDDRAADRRAGRPAAADRHGRSDDHERGLDLRVDQRLERARQLRLDLMGRQQLRRIAGDQPVHAEQSAVRPAVRVPGRSRARPTPAASGRACSSGSTTSRPC